jgi:oxygen-independent coproporphyrinogen III oxidase
MSAARPLSLYVHIPFCLSKCAYCDFASVPVAGADVGGYVAALSAELGGALARLADEGRALATVFVGGGTPTVLPERELCGVIERALAAPTVGDVEVTVEANPGTVDATSLRALRLAGANRLSLGVQSLCDASLRALGRAHTADDARRAVAAARDAGFDNLSVDLLFAIPGEPPAVYEATLAEVCGWGLPHVSAYSLTFEPGTPLTRARDAGRVAEAPEEAWALLFERTEDILAGAGLARYEISNFARPGAECAHNLNYWHLGEYVGIGAAAHSFVDGERRWNLRDPQAYAAAVHAGDSPTEGRERPTAEQRRIERIMLGLRLTEGLVLPGLHEPGTPTAAGPSETVRGLIGAGLLERVANRVALTREGRLVADTVILRLV